MSRLNDEGLAIIKAHEGISLTPYLCPAGKWTIGYGHTSGVNEKTPPITTSQACELLLRDVRAAEGAVSRLVSAALNDNQFSALVSFVFNLGEGNFAKSTLLRRLNGGMSQEAADEFRKWVYGRDPSTGLPKKLPGLKSRRDAERALFLKPPEDKEIVA